MNKRGLVLTTYIIIAIIAVFIALVGLVGYNVVKQQKVAQEALCLPILSDLGIVDSRYNCYVQTEDIAVTSFAVKFEEELVGFQVTLINSAGEPESFEVEEGTQLENIRQITKNYGEPLSLPEVGEQEVYVVQGFYPNVEIYPITEKDGEQLVCGLSDSKSLQGCDSEISGLLSLGLPDGDGDGDTTTTTTTTTGTGTTGGSGGTSGGTTGGTDGGPPGPACGDGSLDPGEQCDDGNNVDGDGCSSICELEFHIALISPQDSAVYGFNESLSLEFIITDPDNNTDSCWYNINSENNITILNCQNTTFDVSGNGNYNLTIYANNTANETVSASASFSVSLGAPIIILISPDDNAYLNDDPVIFTYNVTDDNATLDSCSLLGDFSGVYETNQTDNAPLNGEINSFSLSLNDGTYLWAIQCNNTLGNSAITGNRTLHIDLTSPIINIVEPTGEYNLPDNIPLNFSVTDASPLSCSYNVVNSTGDVVIVETLIPNCQNTSFNLTVVDIENFVLYLTAVDEAGNLNTESSAFTVDILYYPSATFIANPTSGNAPLDVTFDASGSFDVDGTIVSYDWEFGDGQQGQGEFINHTYLIPGNYVPFLTVTDDDGLNHTVNSVNITVTEDVPAAPSNLIATAMSTSQIDLTWTDNSDNEDGFIIERALSSDFAILDFSVIIGENVNSYSDTGLIQDTTYFYRVLAFNSVGNSSFSNIASAATFAVPIPSVDIISPLDNSTVITSNVSFDFTITDWIIGGFNPLEDHIHFHLDSDPIAYMFYNGNDNVVYYGSGFNPTDAAEWIDSDTIRFNNLPEGNHNVRAILVNAAHNELGNPEAESVVEFVVDTSGGAECDYIINPGESINLYSSVAQPGETVCVRAGNYTETLTPQNSGTPENLITFKAYPGEGCQGGYDKINCQVVIDGEAVRSNAMNLNSRSYIRVEGFETKNHTGAEINAQFSSGGIEIVNNYLHENARKNDDAGYTSSGIDLRGSGGSTVILIEGNEMSELFRGIWWIETASNVNIKGNHIWKGYCDALRGTGHQNIIIEQNIIHSAYVFVNACHPDGLDLAGNINNIIIRNNILYDYTQHIYFPTKDNPNLLVENVEVYGNLIYTTDEFYSSISKGIFVDVRNAASFARNISIHSNTVFWMGQLGIGVLGNANEITIRDNIMYNSTHVDSIALLIVDLDDPNPIISSDYNIFNLGQIKWEGATYNTLAQFQAGTGQDLNSTEANPGFVDPVTFDFHLNSTSPAIDAGDPALASLFNLPDPWFDIDGTTRPQDLGYDIGAFEFVGGGQEAQCNDGIDNDGDFAIDDEDNDCYTDGIIYYISSSEGDDAWSGLEPIWNGSDGPKQSLAAADNILNNIANPGDKVIFKRGDVWTDSGGMTLSTTVGNMTDPIIFGAYGTGPKPLFDINSTGTVILIRGSNGIPSQHLRIENIHITTSRIPGDRPTLGIYIVETFRPNLPHNITFSGLVIEGLKFGAIIGHEDVLLENSIIKDNYGIDPETGHTQGLFGSHPIRLIVRNNTFENNGKPGVGFDHNTYLSECEDCIYENNIVRGHFSGLKIQRGKNIIVRGNQMYDLDFSTITAGGDNNFFVENVTIEKNILHDTGVAINIKTQSGPGNLSFIKDMVIKNNIIYNIGQGIVVHSTNIDNYSVYNNLVYNASGINIAVKSSANETNVKIKNNIVMNPVGVGGDLMHIQNGDLSEIELDNNLYYNIIGNVVYAGVGYASLNAFRSDYPTQELNGQEGDPELVNPTQDFHLTGQSTLAIDKGVDLSGVVDDDFEGDIRPFDGDGSGTAEWDIGAYEFLGGGAQCNIISAFWNTTDAVEGDIVELTVEGTSCDGQEVNFTVIEDDGILPDDLANIQPANAFFSGDTATTTWVAEWELDQFFTDPEYYFDAVLVSNASETIQSGLLFVTQLPPGAECGNGIIEGGESCDDNNTISGDGCSDICQIEPGWQCTGEPSVCTETGTSIAFVSPTPDDGSTQTNTDIYVNLSTAYDTTDHYAFVDFDKDLVLWMRMDDTNSSGDPTDLSSYSNNGSLSVNVIINSTGYFGNASHFDGLSGVINAGSDVSIGNVFDGGGTIMVWIAPNSAGETGNGRILDKDNTGNAGAGWLFYTRSSSGGMAFIHDFTINKGQWTAGSFAFDGSWIHVAIVYDSDADINDPVIYLDGSSVTVTRILTPSGTRDDESAIDLHIGNIGADTKTFDGIIDEVLIFNRSLSSDEISALYNATATQYENNFTNLADNTYTFTGHAVDLAGNKNQTEERSVTIDSTPLAGNNFFDDYIVNITVNTNVNQSTINNVSWNGSTLTHYYPTGVGSGEVSTQGLVAYYNFDNNTDDQSGNNNNGTINGNPVYVDGVVGQALEFDGVDDYVQTSNPFDSYDGSGGFSGAAWFNADITGGTIFERCCNNLEISFSGGALGCTIRSLGGGFVFTSTFTANLNEWYHAACVYDPIIQNLTFYINGSVFTIVDASSFDVFRTPSGKLGIGARPDNFGGYFNGTIDEVQIYNRALTPEEIQSLASGGVTGSFESPQIDTSGVYYGLNASWFETASGVNLRLSIDNGANWCSVGNGNGLAGTVCDPLVGVSDFRYEVTFSDNTNIDWVNFSWNPEPPPPECVTDPDCDDSNVCNGAETCVAGSCQEGTPLLCDNGLFCDGTETCDAVLGCQAGIPVNCDDGILCTTGDSCNEVTDSCDNIPDDTLCPPGEICVAGLGCAVPGEINIDLQASRQTCVAPCGVFFDATGTTTTAVGVDDPFWQLEYDWDFDDFGAVFVNRPGIDANKAKGALGAHVFENPGDYIVTLTVRGPDGELAAQQVIITVQDPDVVYSGATYCVSDVGDFTACPVADGAFHLNDFNSAMLTLFASNGPRRMLFHRGDTFTTTSSGKFENTGPFLIGAFGTGENPIIFGDHDDVMIFTRNDASDLAITGITFMSSYNASTGLGRHPDGFITVATGTNNVTLYRNLFTGLGLNIFRAGVNYIFADNHITNWQDYGFLVGLTSSAIIGNSIKQSIDATSGTDGKCGTTCSPNTPDHGPIRTNTQKALISQNDMFNNAGWFVNDPDFGGTHQANLRIGGAGIANLSIVSDNLMEGGFGIVSFGVQANDPGVIGSIIFERNRFLATNTTQNMIGGALPGVIIRNNIFIKKNEGHEYVTFGESAFARGITFTLANFLPEDEANRDIPNYIYGNTFISLEEERGSSVRFLEVQDNSLTNFVVKDNIAYFPFINDTGSVPQAGFVNWITTSDISGLTSDNNVLYAPNYSFFYGINFVGKTLAEVQALGKELQSLETDPLFVDVNNLDMHLSSASSAIDAGALLIGLFEDFDGNIRPFDGDGSGTAEWDIGAYEFSAELSPPGGEEAQAPEGGIGDFLRDLLERLERLKSLFTPETRGNVIKEVNDNSFSSSNNRLKNENVESENNVDGVDGINEDANAIDKVPEDDDVDSFKDVEEERSKTIIPTLTARVIDFVGGKADLDIKRGVAQIIIAGLIIGLVVALVVYMRKKHRNK